jgi:hypothetical protein
MAYFIAERLGCLIHHQLDGGVAAQGFGIGASFVSFVHDVLSLGAIDLEIASAVNKVFVIVLCVSLLAPIAIALPITLVAASAFRYGVKPCLEWNKPESKANG